MKRTLFAMATSLAVVVAACGSGATPPPGSTGPTASTASGGSQNPASAAPVSGTAILSGWQSSPSEGNALTKTLLGFQAANPDVKVDYQPVAGDYPTVMATKFASGDVPDVFYVNADYAQQWITEGYLAPLDDYIANDAAFGPTSSSRAIRPSSRAPMARPTASPRTATRSAWPTTPRS